MINIGRFRIYTGASLWGWRMVGIGWGSLWFCGVSINPPTKPTGWGPPKPPPPMPVSASTKRSPQKP